MSAPNDAATATTEEPRRSSEHNPAPATTIGGFWLDLDNTPGLAWFALVCVVFGGAVPATARIVLACIPGFNWHAESFGARVGLDALRSWQWSLVSGTLPLAYNVVWHRYVEGRAFGPRAQWLPFALKQCADFFLWGILLSIISAILFNAYKDPILK